MRKKCEGSPRADAVCLRRNSPSKGIVRRMWVTEVPCPHPSCRASSREGPSTRSSCHPRSCLPWNLSSWLLVPIFPSSPLSPQAGCPCSMADEASGPSPIPSRYLWGPSGVPGTWHCLGHSDLSPWRHSSSGHTGVVKNTAAPLLPNNLPARPPSCPHCLPL